MHCYPPSHKAVNVSIKDRRLGSIKRIHCNQHKPWKAPSGLQCKLGAGAGLQCKPGAGAGLRRQLHSQALGSLGFPRGSYLGAATLCMLPDTGIFCSVRGNASLSPPPPTDQHTIAPLLQQSPSTGCLLKYVCSADGLVLYFITTFSPPGAASLSVSRGCCMKSPVRNLMNNLSLPQCRCLPFFPVG